MASARSRKSLSVEEILAETCTDTLSGGPRDVLSESDDDNDDDNESYSDFEPGIARKMKRTAHHLSSDSEVGVSSKKTSMIKVIFM
jgi:hypothetical protein